MKAQSPLLGFNNNVRHKGRVFHIQTEDSGVKHPHVITHLFADGGRIVRSTKTSYGEYLGDDEMSRKVRSLMQEQHKAMFIALRAGKFDHLLDGIPLADATGGHRAPMDSTLSLELDSGSSPGAKPSSPGTGGRPSVASTAAKADAPAPTASAPGSPAAAAPTAESPAVSGQPGRSIPPPADIEFEETESPRTLEPHVPSEGLRRLTPPPGSAPGLGAPRASAPPPRPSMPAPPGSASSPPPRAQPSVPPAPRSASIPPPRPQPPVEPAPAPRRAPPPLPAAALRGGPRPDPRAEQDGASRQPPAPPQRPPLALRPSTPPPPPSAPERTPAPSAAASSPGRSGALLATLGSGVPSPPKPASLGATPSVPRRISPLATPSLGASSRANVPAAPPPLPGRPPAAAGPAPAGGRAPMQSSLDLDLEALERAAEQGHSPVYRQVRDLPPPPAAVLRSSTGETAYRSITPPGPQGPGGPPSQAPGAAGRYAPSRPASIFGNARPQEGSSIFGEDLISEKSLDEVILSYLAEDLESPPKK